MQSSNGAHYPRAASRPFRFETAPTSLRARRARRRRRSDLAELANSLPPCRHLDATLVVVVFWAVTAELPPEMRCDALGGGGGSATAAEQRRSREEW